MNGYGSAGRPTAAGLERVVRRGRRLDLPDVGLHAERERRRHTYGTPLDEDPRLYQTDVYREKAVDFIERRAPLAAAVLPLGRVPRAASRERGGARADGTAGPPRAAARRHIRRRRRSPTPPAFAERDRSDKPGLRAPRGPPSPPQAIGRIARAPATAASRCWRSTRPSRRSSAALRRTGELENTYMVFTSDNGYMQGEHDVPSGKMLPYEPSTRVPLIVRGPGIPAGRGVEQLVGNVDLAPTILGRRRAGRGAARRPLAAAVRSQPGAPCAGAAARDGRAAATCGAATRTPAACERCGACSATGRCAPSAGSTSSTATAGASCTTSSATPGSCAPFTPRRPSSRPGTRLPPPCAGWRTAVVGLAAQRSGVATVKVRDAERRLDDRSRGALAPRRRS